VHGAFPLFVDIAMADAAPFRIFELAARHWPTCLRVEKGREEGELLLIHSMGRAADGQAQKADRRQGDRKFFHGILQSIYFVEDNSMIIISHYNNAGEGKTVSGVWFWCLGKLRPGPGPGIILDSGFWILDSGFWILKGL